MPVAFTAEQLREKYNEFAGWYDPTVWIFEVLAFGRLRRRLLRRASGRVLEVAVGTGRNLSYYPGDVSLTAVDLSPGMIDIARRRATKRGLDVDFREMDAQSLAFPDASFDTVVSTLSTCTFPDPVAALGEMGRVCRTEGRILLLEHGRSSRPRLARWQDRRADRHAEHLGCHWNREPLDLLRQARLTVIHAERHDLGIVHLIVAQPAGEADAPVL